MIMLHEKTTKLKVGLSVVLGWVWMFHRADGLLFALCRKELWSCSSRSRRRRWRRSSRGRRSWRENGSSSPSLLKEHRSHISHHCWPFSKAQTFHQCWAWFVSIAATGVLVMWHTRTFFFFWMNFPALKNLLDHSWSVESILAALTVWVLQLTVTAQCWQENMILLIYCCSSQTGLSWFTLQSRVRSRFRFTSAVWSS